MVDILPFMFARIGDTESAYVLIVLVPEVFRARERPDLAQLRSAETADLRQALRPLNRKAWFPEYFQG